MSRIRCDRKIRNRRISGFTGSVTDDRRETGVPRHFNRIQSFGQRTDLIHFDKNRIRRLPFNRFLQIRDIRHKQVISDKLDVCAKLRGILKTKKIGHAVQRNRARRVMKAAIDEHLDYNIGGYDLIFVARGMTPKLKSWQLSSVVAKLFAQAGLPDKAKRPDAKPPATVPPARKQKPESRA